MSMLEDRSCYINASESAKDTDGEVNLTHAYYNGSRTSKDKEDPSWSTSIKTRRQRRHLQHWKRLGCNTFDLVPLSYESVDVVIGENWFLRHKAEMVCHEKVVKMHWSCKVRVGSNGNLLWEASVLLGMKKGGVRVACEDDRRVTKGREDVREVFQQRRSGAKRKLSRCRRNQLGNEPILALPKGADDFVVYYDARSKDLEACLEKGRRQFLFDELRVLMPRVVKSRDEIFSRWGYCDNRGLSRLDNQSIERDRLIGIGFVLDFVEFISFTFGDKEMILVIEAVSR
ncbi:hypothetical protein Tco_0373782 [Tanacetum coccineum]